MEKTQKGTLVYNKGETIIKEGDRDKTIFFLVSGKVGIYKDGKLVGVIDKPNSPIGEISAILEGQRTASCVALEKTEVVAYTGGIDEIIKKYPKTTKAIIKNLAERVAKATGELAKIKGSQSAEENKNPELQKSNISGNSFQGTLQSEAERNGLFSYLLEISQPDFAKVLKYLTEKEIAILIASGGEKLKERILHFMSQRRIETINELLNAYSGGKVPQVEILALEEKLQDILGAKE